MDATTFSSFGLDPLKDQFLLFDETTLDTVVNCAELSKDDVVLEIGAGSGSLTRKLAAKAGRVVAFEYDDRFRPFLSDVPSNVEVKFQDAWEYLRMVKGKGEFNKIVSNLPYSFCEKLLHKLIYLDYEKAVFIMPLVMLKTINTHPIFSAYFCAEEICSVSRKLFYPVPRTNSAGITLRKLPDPVGKKDLSRFLRQYVYQRNRQKVKSSLREGIIDFAKLALGKTVTKKQSEAIIEERWKDNKLLTSLPTVGTYKEIKDSFGLLSDNFVPTSEG